jgi:hypothetical protein
MGEQRIASMCWRISTALPWQVILRADLSGEDFRVQPLMKFEVEKFGAGEKGERPTMTLPYIPDSS